MFFMETINDKFFCINLITFNFWFQDYASFDDALEAGTLKAFLKE